MKYLYPALLLIRINTNTHKKKTEPKKRPCKKHLRKDVTLALFLIRSSLPLWGLSEHSHYKTWIPLTLLYLSPQPDCLFTINWKTYVFKLMPGDLAGINTLNRCLRKHTSNAWWFWNDFPLECAPCSLAPSWFSRKVAHLQVRRRWERSRCASFISGNTDGVNKKHNLD